MEMHLQHLDKFLAALAINGLAINLEKCVFAVPTLEFLGHKISATGLAPAAYHTAEIKKCPPPGHQATALFSQHAKLLLPFPAKLRSGVAPFNRSPKGGTKGFGMDRHNPGLFSKVKQLLATTVPLQHPSPTAELSLATDTSDTHISGIMQQKSGTHFLAAPWFFLSEINRYRILIFNS
jgi:hypothetical protein